MRPSPLSSSVLLLALCATASAQSHRADFDGVAEGVLGTTYVEDGIVFSNLDRYLGSSSELFVAEDASSTLAGSAGFTAPNALAFGGWAPGPTAGYSRCGSFDITPPPGIYDHVELRLWLAGTSSIGNVVTLEARLGGGLVTTDSWAVPGAGTYGHLLVIDGEDFDSLHLVATGPSQSGAIFALVDSVVFGASTPPGTAYCIGDGSGTDCPCGNEAGPHTGCQNSTGNGAELVSVGSAGLTANDLGFQIAGMTPTQPVLLFAGQNAVNGGLGTQFGDGLRCAGGSVTRLGVHTSTVVGEAFWDPGVLGGHGWSSGDTVRF